MAEDDDIFPDPHGDEAAGDAVVEPEDDFTDEEVGSSPVEEARKPRRRWAIFLVAGAVVVLGAIFLLAGGDDGGDQPTVDQASVGEFDTTERAQTPEQAARQRQEEDNPLQEGQQVGEGTQAAEEGASSEELGGGQQMEEDFDFSAPNQPDQQQGQQPTGQQQQQPGQQASQDTSLNQYFGDGQGGQGQSTGDNPLGQQGQEQPRRLSEDDLERQKLLDSLRVAQQEQEAQQQEKAEAQATLEERLRGAGTEIATGDVDLSANNQGQSRFSTGSTGRSSGSSVSQASSGGRSGAGVVPSEDEDTGVEYDIVPGAKARAVTTSQFISDLEGSGQIQARITKPLRNRNNEVVLPVGTQAYGDARAQGGTDAGQQARVSVRFNTFVRPDGSVIRGLDGQAADPETLATSVEGNVDNRLMERVLRGGASIALDFALTSGQDDRRSAFEAPSPRDQAINDARQRVARIVEGNIGDEESREPAITLEQDTELVIIFGL